MKQTSAINPLACRYCGMPHGPTCWMVKAIEYHADGITVKRVEFKTGKDYEQQVVSVPSVFPPIRSEGFAGLPEQHQASSVPRVTTGMSENGVG
jgi:hypothetical protein